MTQTAEFYITMISSSFAIVGCLLIIATHLYFSELKKQFYRQLVFILSIYDLLLGIGCLFPGGSWDSICSGQGIYLTGISLAPPIWTACISILTWLRISRNVSGKKLRRISLFLNFFLWIVCLIFFFLASFFGDIKNTPPTHWCSPTSRTILTAVYVTYWLSLVVMMVFYFLLIDKIRKESKRLQEHQTTKSQEKRSAQIRMSIIPISYFFLVIWSSIKRTREVAHPDCSEIEWLDIMQAIFDPLQGFIDCLIFVIFASKVRNKIPLMLRCKKSQVPKKIISTQINDKLLININNDDEM
ncbi:g protein-coupled receptor [Anaeramoeba ignava]|uniref:G protein-coupled receptor n=1 Tax=Anaeramoeba ignava TaxID=1746090 RepID=A0A9Q0LWG7_ANAIG|nr:g protein-coupled receptor [Anaeramoeba ignava]|eukprot:Anaeramoba_ignava/a611153_9.p1 GENE.a611153_9~~a611153_9.p1  ORF type:complete len:316 (-),score=57.08 a611153_9:36-932(-)